MAKKESSPLIKFEFIVFGALLLLLLVWGSRKCSRTQADLEAQAIEEEEDAATQALIDSLAAVAANAGNQQQSRPAQPAPNVARDTMRGGNLEIIRERITPLYVLIDGLNMRSGPGLEYEIVDRFPLHEEIYFMRDVTDSIYEINLGKRTFNAPWVKVQSRKGREGWVYGACVDYYKYTLEGGGIGGVMVL